MVIGLVSDEQRARVTSLIRLGEIHRAFAVAADALSAYLGVPLCVEDCGKCCESNVPHCYAIEGSYAVSYLLGTGKLAEVLTLAEGWVLERHVEATIYEGMPFGAVDLNIVSEYDRLKRTPCPFLGYGKMCLIYGCRPLACRAYGVTRVPGPECPRPIGVTEAPGMRVTLGGELGSIIRKGVEDFLANLPDKGMAINGFLPTMLFRAADRVKLMRHVANNEVASAKLVGTEQAMSLLWQEQVEAEAGIVPNIPPALAQVLTRRQTRQRILVSQ